MYVPTGIVDVVHTAKAAALTFRLPMSGLAIPMTVGVIPPARLMAALIVVCTRGGSPGKSSVSNADARLKVN